MRLDLEEYDFDIEHIPGKDNVGADALSRMDFKDIQNLANKIALIYKMTTRSETRKNQSSTNNIANNEFKEVPEHELKAYEILTPVEVKALPKLIFYLHNGIQRCVVKLKRRILISFKLSHYIVHGTLKLQEVVSFLERSASNMP